MEFGRTRRSTGTWAPASLAATAGRSLFRGHRLARQASGLGPGAVETVTFHPSISGEHVWCIIVDTTNLVYESNENNNIGPEENWYIYDFGDTGPDLEITDFTFYTDSIEIEVTNNGVSSTSSTFRVDIFTA